MEPVQNETLKSFHKRIYREIEQTDETKGFENENYHPRVTLGGTSWGMTKEELKEMEEKAKIKFPNKISFIANFVRVYRKPTGQKSWDKLEDIYFT